MILWNKFKDDGCILLYVSFYFPLPQICVVLPDPDLTQLSSTFSNLRDVYLYNISQECNLNWTLFVLEAAPSLKNLYITVINYMHLYITVNYMHSLIFPVA